MYADKQVLVTGGNGDLGRLLAPKLQSHGMRVHSLDPAGDAPQNVEHIRGSILDRELLQRVTRGIDLVVHVAAWHGFHAFTASKTNTEFWDLNMTGTFNLLEACVASGIRKFVFISSSSVDEWPEMYGVTKVLGEQLCRAYVERGSLEVISLRPRAFIPWWNKVVYASKDEWASWFARGAVHIADVAEATRLSCLVLLDSSDVRLYEACEIDGKHDFSQQELAEWRQAGGRSLLKRRFPEFESFIDDATFIPDDPPTYKDISQAQRILGYTPSYGFYELLKEMSQIEPDRSSR